MITGKTKSGFVYAIPEKRIHNMELLDALVEVERGSDAGLSDALNLLLGKDLKKKLYDLHRDEDGIVDGEAVANDFVQILLDYKAGKNSCPWPGWQRWPRTSWCATWRKPTMYWTGAPWGCRWRPPWPGACGRQAAPAWR